MSHGDAARRSSSAKEARLRRRKVGTGSGLALVDLEGSDKVARSLET